MNKFLYIDGTGRNYVLKDFTIQDFFRLRSYFEGHALELFQWGRYAEEGSRYSTGSFTVICTGI
jgi:hypothetical protein